MRVKKQTTESITLWLEILQKKYRKGENLFPPAIKCHMLDLQKNNHKNLITVHNKSKPTKLVRSFTLSCFNGSYSLTEEAALFLGLYMGSKKLVGYFTVMIHSLEKWYTKGTKQQWCIFISTLIITISFVMQYLNFTHVYHLYIFPYYWCYYRECVICKSMHRGVLGVL